MRKWKNKDWKTWFRTQPGIKNAVTVILGVILVVLLIGIVAAAFRFVWSAFVLITLIALALLALGKLRQQGVKIPIRLPSGRNRKHYRERKAARRHG